MPGPKKETSVDIGVITVCPAERRRCLLLGGGWGGVAYAYIHQPSQGLPRCLPTPEPSPPAPCSPCTPSSASSRAVPSRAPPQPGKAKMRLQDRHPPGSSPFPALRTEVPRTLGGGMRRQRGVPGTGGRTARGGAGHPYHHHHHQQQAPPAPAQRSSAGRQAQLSTGCRGAQHPSGGPRGSAWSRLGGRAPAGCSGLLSAPPLVPPHPAPGPKISPFKPKTKRSGTAVHDREESRGRGNS